ncbi:MAG: hypothetical protein J0L61_09175, partial [Planctomycetes bacterium]|nr:hypothetical protein [Planctomycetota bacterium]
VLFDLSGNTMHTRSRVFAFGPAPVQVSYLGYANTSGMPGMHHSGGSPRSRSIAYRRGISTEGGRWNLIGVTASAALMTTAAGPASHSTRVTARRAPLGACLVSHAALTTDSTGYSGTAYLTSADLKATSVAVRPSVQISATRSSSIERVSRRVRAQHHTPAASVSIHGQ